MSPFYLEKSLLGCSSISLFHFHILSKVAYPYPAYPLVLPVELRFILTLSVKTYTVLTHLRYRRKPEEASNYRSVVREWASSGSVPPSKVTVRLLPSAMTFTNVCHGVMIRECDIRTSMSSLRINDTDGSLTPTLTPLQHTPLSLFLLTIILIRLLTPLPHNPHPKPIDSNMGLDPFPRYASLR